MIVVKKSEKYSKIKRKKSVKTAEGVFGELNCPVAERTLEDLHIFSEF